MKVNELRIARKTADEELRDLESNQDNNTCKKSGNPWS